MCLQTKVLVFGILDTPPELFQSFRWYKSGAPQEQGLHLVHTELSQKEQLIGFSTHKNAGPLPGEEEEEGQGGERGVRSTGAAYAATSPPSQAASSAPPPLTIPHVSSMLQLRN